MPTSLAGERATADEHKEARVILERMDRPGLFKGPGALGLRL